MISARPRSYLNKEIGYDNNNRDVIEKFAEYMGGREDVWYATNIKIISYIKAYDSLVFSLDMSCVYNPTATDVCIQLNKGERKYLVHAGEMLELV